MEHQIWRGERYNDGLRGGLKVAIMGYSHWDDAADHERKTIDTIEGVLSGDDTPKFFSTIRNYFGLDAHADFWPMVLFFNYLPETVGGGSERYRNGTAAQYEAAEGRFMRVIDDHKPDIIFAFSTKVHDRLPNGFIEAATRLKSGHAHGHYDHGGHRTAVAMLPHPQGANGASMRQAIDEMLGSAV